MTTLRPLYAPPKINPHAVESKWLAEWGPFLDAAGLDVPEGLVLSALWEADGATERGLTRRAHVPPTVVCRCVENLDLLGYAEREAGSVWLTDDGFRLCEQATEVWR